MKSSGLKNTCYAQGGPVVGTTSKFFKAPESFRSAGPGQQNYASKGGNKAKDKSLSPVKPRS